MEFGGGVWVFGLEEGEGVGFWGSGGAHKLSGVCVEKVQGDRWVGGVATWTGQVGMVGMVGGAGRREGEVCWGMGEATQVLHGTRARIWDFPFPARDSAFACVWVSVFG